MLSDFLEFFYDYITMSLLLSPIVMLYNSRNDFHSLRFCLVEVYSLLRNSIVTRTTVNCIHVHQRCVVNTFKIKIYKLLMLKICILIGGIWWIQFVALLFTIRIALCASDPPFFLKIFDFNNFPNISMRLSFDLYSKDVRLND